MVRYKYCGNVVVFLAFRYVVLALALGVVALLTSLIWGTVCIVTSHVGRDEKRRPAGQVPLGSSREIL